MFGKLFSDRYTQGDPLYTGSTVHYCLNIFIQVSLYQKDIIMLLPSKLARLAIFVGV